MRSFYGFGHPQKYFKLRLKNYALAATAAKTFSAVMVWCFIAACDVPLVFAVPFKRRWKPYVEADF